MPTEVWSAKRYREHASGDFSQDNRAFYLQRVDRVTLNRISIALPYPPSSNANWRNVNGRTILSAKARAYKKAVAAITAGMDPILGPVRLTLRVFRPRKAGDLMNREKLISDCLQGAAFKNDSQIHEAHLYLFDDKARPRVEVLVEAMDTQQPREGTR